MKVVLLGADFSILALPSRMPIQSLNPVRNPDI
jgi:hypothetical protein